MAKRELCAKEASYLRPSEVTGVSVHTFRFMWHWPVGDREAQFFGGLGVFKDAESPTSKVIVWGMLHSMGYFDDSDCRKPDCPQPVIYLE